MAKTTQIFLVNAYATPGDLPPQGWANAEIAIVQSNHSLYTWDSGGSAWLLLSTGGGGAVNSVTDDGNGVVVVNNAAPSDPVVEFNGVFVDGVTITGNGQSGNPLVATATTTSPGGLNTQVQFNDSGVFGGDSGLVFIKATNRLGVGGIAAPTSTIEAYDNTYPSTLPYITSNGVALTLNNTTGSSVMTSHYSTAGGSNSSVLDFLPDIVQYPDIGLRFVRYNVLGANDAFMQLFSTAVGYSILEGTLGIGFLLTTTGTSINAPVMIGPDRVPKVYYYTDHFEMKPHGTSAGNTYEQRFLELAANGTNYFATKAADNIATTRTMVWPNDDPATDDVLKVTSFSAGIITTEWDVGGGGINNIDGGFPGDIYSPPLSPLDGGVP